MAWRRSELDLTRRAAGQRPPDCAAIGVVALRRTGGCGRLPRDAIRRGWRSGVPESRGGNHTDIAAVVSGIRDGPQDDPDILSRGRNRRGGGGWFHHVWVTEGGANPARRRDARRGAAALRVTGWRCDSGRQEAGCDERGGGGYSLAAAVVEADGRSGTSGEGGALWRTVAGDAGLGGRMASACATSTGRFLAWGGGNRAGAAATACSRAGPAIPASRDERLRLRADLCFRPRPAIGKICAIT